MWTSFKTLQHLYCDHVISTAQLIKKITFFLEENVLFTTHQFVHTSAQGPFIHIDWWASFTTLVYQGLVLSRCVCIRFLMVSSVLSEMSGGAFSRLMVLTYIHTYIYKYIHSTDRECVCCKVRDGSCTENKIIFVKFN